MTLRVVVTDGHGHPVTGLKRSDFKLAEDGTYQDLIGFSEHDATTPPATHQYTSLSPENTFRVQAPGIASGAVVVILFDRVNLEDSRYMREQLIGYLNSSELTMPMAILVDSADGTHLIQPLTLRKDVLLEALSSERLQQVLRIDAEPRKPTYMNGSLRLTNFLGSIPGRVNVIRFTSGSEGGFLPDADPLIRDENGVVTAMEIGHAAFYTMHSSPLDLEAESPGGHGRPGSIMGMLSDGMPFAYGESNGLGTESGGLTFDDHEFGKPIAEVMQVGAHYYELSYIPTNQTWDGTYRRLYLNVAGHSRPLSARRLKEANDSRSEKIDPNLEYARGYHALPNPAARATSARDPRAIDLEEGRAPRRLLTDPSRRPIFPGRRFPLMNAAMLFGTATPIGVPFTLTIHPSADTTEGESGDTIESGSMDKRFRTSGYRVYKLQYSIDPKDLLLASNQADSFSEQLQFVAVVYTDNGIEVNSIFTPGHIQGDAEDRARMLKGPIVFEQEMAVPSKGFFYLRAGVHEFVSNHIGVIELPLSEVSGAGPATH